MQNQEKIAKWMIPGGKTCYNNPNKTGLYYSPGIIELC